MKNTKFSRRDAAKALGMGAAASAVLVSRSASLLAAASELPEGAPAAQASSALRGLQPEALSLALVAPLQAGSKLGRWVVQAILPLSQGVVSVVLSDSVGQPFQLDVVARSEAPIAPGVSEFFEVLLVNQGNGRTATEEERGLAAMALAEVIRSNEHSVERREFVSAEKWRSSARQRLHEAASSAPPVR